MDPATQRALEVLDTNLPRDLKYKIKWEDGQWRLTCSMDGFSVRFSGGDPWSLLWDAETFFDDKPGEDAASNGEESGSPCGDDDCS